MTAIPAARLAIAIGLLWSFMIATPAVFAQPAGAAAVDPVVNDVVRMVEVGIEPDLIMQWLESSGRRPGPLSADDVIALSQAKAPRELIQALLDLAAPVAAAPPAPVAPAGPVPASPSLPPPVPPGIATADGECCLIDFSVEYRVSEDKEGEEFEGVEHDLFLYTDGHFLARFSSQGDIASRGPIPFKALVAPGDHTLRLTRELHVRRGQEWAHHTTVSPASIPFRVEPGASWNMDLRWLQSEFSLKKPLHWRWSRNGVEVVGQKNVGEFREDWSYLCEDVEASRDSGTMSEWRAKDRLKNCVTWKSLWPTGVQTTRTQVLDILRQDDFDPPIRSVGRID